MSVSAPETHRKTNQRERRTVATFHPFHPFPGASPGTQTTKRRILHCNIFYLTAHHIMPNRIRGARRGGGGPYQRLSHQHLNMMQTIFVRYCSSLVDYCSALPAKSCHANRTSPMPDKDIVRIKLSWATVNTHLFCA